MPNKTIYVSDELLPVFKEAQDLAGGNLSAAIAAALRQYVTDRSLEERHFGRVAVTVGTTGVLQEKRFYGRQIARWNDAGRYYFVYVTQRENVALELRGRSIPAERSVARFPRPAEARPRGEGAEGDGDAVDATPILSAELLPPAPDAFADESGRFLYVYDSFESFRQDVPETLARIADQSLREPLTEDLDI